MVPTTYTELPAIVLLMLLASLCYHSVRDGILPQNLTLGGAALGLILVTLYPQSVQRISYASAFSFSLLGTITGLFCTWTLLELSKAMFGKLIYRYPEALAFTILLDANFIHHLFVGEKVISLPDVFIRIKDRMTLQGANILIHSTVAIPIQNEDVQFIKLSSDTLWIDDASIPLESVVSITGTVDILTIPREPIGFGIVLTSAMIGAFTGWLGVLLILACSIILLLIVTTLYACSARTQVSERLELAPYMLISSILFFVSKHFLFI